MLDLIPVCYWHEYLDMVFFFKCTHGITVFNNELLPTIQNRERATRSADPSSLIYKTKKCKTATYQKSFLTRSTRLWNILPKDLTHKNTTFNSFKSGLLAYYKLASKTVYDAEERGNLYVCVVIRLVTYPVQYIVFVNVCIVLATPNKIKIKIRN